MKIFSIVLGGAVAVAASHAPLNAAIDLGDNVVLIPRQSAASNRTAMERKSNHRLPSTGRHDLALNSENIASGKNITETIYSGNWAGAVLSGKGIKTITGTIVVPRPALPAMGSKKIQYAASAWVGIDGDSCTNAILQTGIDMYIKGTAVSFDAWYEWYPDYAYTFSGFVIKAGNSIRMTASASTTSSGYVKLENLSTGKSVTHTFPTQSAKLCEVNAEWIVEDFQSGSSLVPFANFEQVSFKDASVTTSTGAKLGVKGAQILDLKQGSQVLTDCFITGSNLLTCNYASSHRPYM